MTLDNKGKGIDTTPTHHQSQWSGLNRELLRTIFLKLEDHSEIYKCGAVCPSWCAVVRVMYPQFLLLSNVGVCRNEDGELHYQEFSNYSKFSNKSCCIIFNPLSLQVKEMSLQSGELEGRWFSSSSLGWLLTVSIHPPHEVHLLNPFSRVQNRINLPPATHFRKREGLRVITSTHPSDPGCLYFAIDPFRYSYAFCRQGDRFWNHSPDYSCRDAIFYMGKCYAVDIVGRLFKPGFVEGFVWYLRKNLLVDHEIEGKSHYLIEKFPYLVEWKGNLLLVVRVKHPPYSKYGTTTGFKAYKWDRVEGQESRWIAVPGIGDYAILLGTFSSISIPVSPYGDFKANCIYFLDDCTPFMNKLRHHDTGVYNMATGRIDWLYEASPIWTSPLNWLRPVSFLM